MSTCNATVSAEGALQPWESDVINTIQIITGACSLTGSVFIVTCFLCFPQLRKFAFRLVFALSLSDVGASLSSFFGNPASCSALCYAQAFTQQYFQVASVLWTTAIGACFYACSRAQHVSGLLLRRRPLLPLLQRRRQRWRRWRRRRRRHLLPVQCAGPLPSPPPTTLSPNCTPTNKRRFAPHTRACKQTPWSHQLPLSPPSQSIPSHPTSSLIPHPHPSHSSRSPTSRSPCAHSRLHFTSPHAVHVGRPWKRRREHREV